MALKIKKTAKYDKEQLVIDWRTGEYSMPDLSKKYKVSVATVHKHVSGVVKDLGVLVKENVQAKQQLAALSEKEVKKVNELVDEKTKHIQFFNNATLKNISVMTKKINSDTSIQDHKAAQDAIRLGRETVLGKTPDTAIQINNNTNTNLKTYSDAELTAIIAQG